MQLIYLGIFFLILLTGCEKAPDEMAEMEKIVLSEDEVRAEWSLPEDRAIATGELLVEESLSFEENK